ASGIWTVVIILSVTGWTGMYRLVRAEYMKHRSREYVLAAQAIGASAAARMFVHILPNVSHVILVQLSLLVVAFIKVEVILSFLGLGVPLEMVSWGTMLSEAQTELIIGKWWQLAAATVFMAIFLTAFSMLTDSLRDALNPVLTVGEQVAEVLRLHRQMGVRQALERAAELLAEVGIPEPRARLRAYPHELSGGQQQRVMIAIAIANEPKLLIADEPTTALDVTVQRQVLELIARLRERHRMSVLFISHDLGLVGELADDVVVMRDGIVRESGPVERIFHAPQDPYTRALLACRP